MAILALADQRPGQGRQFHVALDLPALGVTNLHAGAFQLHPIALFEITDAVGQRRQRQSIGAQIHLAVAVAHRQGAAFAGAEHQVMAPGKNDGEREGPLEAGEGRTDGLFGSLLLGQIFADQVDDHFRVGLGFESAAGRLQLAAQLLEILDNAVVDDRNIFVGVRVGVGFARPAMGGPAGVADADGARDRRGFEQGLQIAELAFGAAALDPPVHQGRHARGVVAPVLETLQGLQQQGRNRGFSQNSDDTAHELRSRFRSRSCRWPAPPRPSVACRGARGIADPRRRAPSARSARGRARRAKRPW